MSEQIKLRRTQGKERERELLQDTTDGQQTENDNYGGDGKNVEEQLAPSPPLLAPKPVLPLTAALMNGMCDMSLSPTLALTTSPAPPILVPASQMMMSSFSSMPTSFSQFSAISSAFAPQPIQSMPTSPWTDHKMYSYLAQSKFTPQLTQTVPQFYPGPFINPDLGSLLSLLSYGNLCFPYQN